MTQLKTIWTWTYRITLSLILFILVYLLSAVILSHITVHSKFHPIPADQAGIDIYVRTNGMHTDLILPAQSSERDWYSIIPPADLHRIEDNTVGQTEYLSFGWGDKGFYLDTPTWADLKFSTAFIAATGLGSTAMHIEAVTTPQVSESVRKIRISPAQLQKLIAHIDQSFEYDAQGKIIKITPPPTTTTTMLSMKPLDTTRYSPPAINGHAMDCRKRVSAQRYSRLWMMG